MQYLVDTVKQHTSEDCLIWPFANVDGYGVIGVPKGRNRRINRIVYEMAHGAIPAGVDICHRCDNPPCYNPRHLFAGTAKDNMDDKQQKGRLLLGEQHQNSILTESEVRRIRAMRKAGMQCPAIAAALGLKSYKHVWKVATGRLWPHITE